MGLKNYISDLKGRDLITTQEWKMEEINATIELARELRIIYEKNGGRIPWNFLDKKTFIMLFYAPSTRTRSAFETAMNLMGGQAQYITGTMTREGESKKDTAKMYEIFGDGIGIRLLDDAIDFVYGNGNKVLREFALHSQKPVINMADDTFHPTQALGDFMTIEDKLRNLQGKKYVLMWAYAPVPRGYCSMNSEMLLGTRLGMDMVVARPKGFDLPDEVVKMARENVKQSGGSLEFSEDYKGALSGAHVVFPRSWVSRRMAEEGYKKFWEEEKQICEKYRNWRLKKEDLDLMDRKGIITHVLPVLRGYEADDEVMDSKKSVIYEQARNNLFAKGSVLLQSLGIVGD
jgi:ornithine carbamoyltransferase